jgi:hypothetical protein
MFRTSSLLNVHPRMFRITFVVLEWTRLRSLRELPVQLIPELQQGALDLIEAVLVVNLAVEAEGAVAGNRRRDVDNHFR